MDTMFEVWVLMGCGPKRVVMMWLVVGPRLTYSPWTAVDLKPDHGVLASGQVQLGLSSQ